MQPLTTPIHQFRAELTVELEQERRLTMSITAPDPDSAKELISTMLNGNATFTTVDNHTAFVYARNPQGEKYVCGWIAQITVPQLFSVKTLTDNRMRELAAA